MQYPNQNPNPQQPNAGHPQQFQQYGQPVYPPQAQQPGGYPPQAGGYPPQAASYQQPQPGYGYGYPQAQALPKKGLGTAAKVAIGVVVALLALVVIAAAIPAGPAKIAEVQTAKGFNDSTNKIENATTVFSPTDNPVHCVVKVDNAKETTRVKANWIAVDAGGEKNLALASKELKLFSNAEYADFTLKLDQDFPEGTYKVEVYLDVTLTKTVNFTVK